MADTASEMEVTDVCDSGTEGSSSLTDVIDVAQAAVDRIKRDENDNIRVPSDTLVGVELP